MNPPYDKTFLYKVSTISGSVTTPLTAWNDVVGMPRFDVAINGGLSEMTVELARSWSNFGETNDVANGNFVELYVADRDTGDDDARLIASGFISGYTPVLSADQSEHIVVTALGNNYRLNESILTVSGNGTTQVDFSSADPSTMFSTIISQYNTTVSGVRALTTDFDVTGTSATYSFNLYTYKQAIDKILELAPANWWYVVNPDDTIDFHPRRYSADHILTIGLHINQIEPFKNIEDIKNQVYFVGTGLQRVYRNSSSIIQYGEKSIVLQDSRVTTTSSADIIAQAYLNSHANPEVRTRLTVLDNNGDSSNRGYDIDSLAVGQMISIIHPQMSFEQTNWDEATFDDGKWDSPIASVLSQPMQIVRLTYMGDRVQLELSTRAPDVSKRIEDINRNLQQYITDQSL